MPANGDRIIEIARDLVSCATDFYTRLAEATFSLGQLQECAEFLEKGIELAARFGPGDARLAGNLNRLGVVRCYLGDFDRAVPLFEQSLSYHERAPEPSPRTTATLLHNLAAAYEMTGRHREAHETGERAVEMAQAAGHDHELALNLDLLGKLHLHQAKHPAALMAFRRSLAIKEKAFGQEHWEVGVTLRNIADFYASQERYNEAEPLYWRAVAIKERILGPGDPGLARDIHGLAEMLSAQRKFHQAETLWRYAVLLLTKIRPPNDPELIAILASLAAICRQQGRLTEAELLARACQRARELTGRRAPLFQAEVLEAARVSGETGIAELARLVAAAGRAG